MCREISASSSHGRACYAPPMATTNAASRFISQHTKANILLSVSAITLSIVLSSLFPKLDKADNSYLIYPTLFFLLIVVVTMIFSILSTRPKITSGKFSKEDLANRKVNLLFFGE